MKEKAIRVYADTSVFGGVFDDEFKKGSERFFDLVRAGDIRLVLSAIVRNEVSRAPGKVQAIFNEIYEYAEVLEASSEAVALQEAYIKANILTSRWEEDALHVALATVAECAIIISWNFKHIVNFRKIPLYNAVNMALGYKTIAIHSPMEVVADEQEKI